MTIEFETFTLASATAMRDSLRSTLKNAKDVIICARTDGWFVVVKF